MMDKKEKHEGYLVKLLQKKINMEKKILTWYISSIAFDQGI